MVVAVVAVWVVEVVVDQVVDVVAVRHRFVPASGPVLVAGVVLGLVVSGAFGGIGVADHDRVLVDPAVVGVVQVSVVEIVHMPVVTDGGVAATWSVLVVVGFMGRIVVVAHERQGRRPSGVGQAREGETHSRAAAALGQRRPRAY